MIGFGLTETMICLASALVIGLYWYSLYINSYWKRNKLPFVSAKPFFGNLFDVALCRKSLADNFSDIYNDPASVGRPFVGIHFFHKPALFVKDPDLIKNILVKDFGSFNDRHSGSDIHTDIMGSTNLLLIRNPAWKILRGRLSPFFTSGKMKQMFHLMKNVGNELDETLMSHNVNDRHQSFSTDIKEIITAYTTDVIASCAFGVEANSLKNPENEFRKNGKKIFEVNWYRSLEFTSIFFMPELVPYFKFKVCSCLRQSYKEGNPQKLMGALVLDCNTFQNSILNNTVPTRILPQTPYGSNRTPVSLFKRTIFFSKQSTAFLRNAINYIMNERERTGTVRNDLIDTLISLKNEDKTKYLTVNNIVFQGDVIVAQAAVFFTGGYETSATAMTLGLYELAFQPDLQKRLRHEIKETLMASKGELTYDVVQSMAYLNMVVQEMLRMYPPLPFLDRKCTNPEGYSLEPHDNFVVPYKMPVLLPVFAIQRDPKFWPNPNQFDPERFSAQNKDRIVPYTFLALGAGPHSCIGERFGYLQMKIGLINFLKNHHVTPTEKTPRVLKFDPKSLFIQSKSEIVLNVVRDPLL